QCQPIQRLLQNELHRLIDGVVLLNVIVMLAVAVAFNYAFEWRRYPSLPGTRQKKPASGPGGHRAIEHADLVAALRQIDSFIDVSEQDLQLIYDLAADNAGRAGLHADSIRLGHYYSNGAYGSDWSVRQVVDESRETNPEKDMVVYKVVAGRGLRTSGVQTRAEFCSWARHEVERDDENWKRVGSSTVDVADRD
ncbi:MAG: hypothetical protein R3308_02405, partial [Thiohalobacterales bacterium]|nr:hypothetical protein [Thiohalobacterales bacterium]